MNDTVRACAGAPQLSSRQAGAGEWSRTSDYAHRSHDVQRHDAETNLDRFLGCAVCLENSTNARIAGVFPVRSFRQHIGWKIKKRFVPIGSFYHSSKIVRLLINRSIFVIAVDFTLYSDILSLSFQIGGMICQRQEKSQAKERIGAIHVENWSYWTMIPILFRHARDVIIPNTRKSEIIRKTAAIVW